MTIVALVFYISGHGFGHASRAIEVINALISRRPELRVVIRSSVALVAGRAYRANRRSASPVEVDTGVVQIDSLNLDAGKSIERAELFMSTFDTRVAHEVEFLRAHDAVMTVSDLPPLGIAAANAAGLPAIALGNFTWDWIYAHYPGGAGLAHQIGDVYAHTTRALRLPMWGGFETMPTVTDLRLSRGDHAATSLKFVALLGCRSTVVSSSPRSAAMALTAWTRTR